MFNFLANCPHIPNFSNLFGASQNEDEIQSYANFGFPEGVSNNDNSASGATDDATTNGASNHSDMGALSPSAQLQDQDTEQGIICEDTPEDEGPWFYIPAGPSFVTQKKNIALAEPAATEQPSTIHPEEDVLCISALADLQMPHDNSPALRSLHKVMDRGWVRFPEA